VPQRLRAAAAEAIADHAAPILAVLQPKVIAGTMPFRGEVDPWPVLRLAAGYGAIVVLPITRPDGLTFHRWTPETALSRSSFGMLEPPQETGALEPDVIIVPIAGFDRSGLRLGYGRGYYDRAIASLRARGSDPRLFGLAYSVQEVAAVPPEDHDIRLEWIVTELEVIDARAASMG
jgi:5-formyltetrahydrofolate cyclo-ligase